MHSSQHWSSHYDLHSMFGWSETEPTLRGVQTTTGKRGLVLSRYYQSNPISLFSKVNLCGVWKMDRPLAWRQLVSLGQHALLHHRCRHQQGFQCSICFEGMLQFNQFGIPLVGADICGFIEDSTEELCARSLPLYS